MPDVQPPLGVFNTETPILMPDKTFRAARVFANLISTLLAYVRANSVWRGTVTFAGSGTALVTFAEPQPDTAYYLSLGGNANETFWWTTKTATGFTARSSNGASTASLDYQVTR